GKIAECFGEAVLAAARELDDDGVMVGVPGIGRELLLEHEVHLLDQEVPEEVFLEMIVRRRVRAGLAVALVDGVVLEALPDHRKVVDLFEFADVEAAAPLLDRSLLEIVDDLALAGGRASRQDDDLERIAHWMDLVEWSLVPVGIQKDRSRARA